MFTKGAQGLGFYVLSKSIIASGVGEFNPTPNYFAHKVRLFYFIMYTLVVRFVPLVIDHNPGYKS